jgi:hypothetical protein
MTIRQPLPNRPTKTPSLHRGGKSHWAVIKPARASIPCHPSSNFTPAMNRRQKIEAMLAEDPNDTFLRYSLAMEMRGEGDHESSLTQLDELTRDQTPYVPAFFMAAQQLADLDRIEDARRYLRDGIDQARNQGDSHAAAEMSELLTTLGEMGEL